MDKEEDNIFLKCAFPQLLYEMIGRYKLQKNITDKKEEKCNSIKEL